MITLDQFYHILGIVGGSIIIAGTLYYWFNTDNDDTDQ